MLIRLLLIHLLKIVTKFYWTLHLSRTCFSPLNRETKLLKRLKNGLIRNVLSRVKNILKPEILVGELNQLKIELILFVVVKHTKRRLISSAKHIVMILFFKLRNLKTKDPKSYWSLLNKSTDQNKTIVNKVALESFYDRFKNLNNVNNDNNDFNFNIQNADVNDNFELNKSFSENDIVHAIKSLKNNKSCGNDLI